MPPGVDLDRWRLPARTPASPLRLLFVGADFARKGGPLLVDVVRSRFRGRVELAVQLGLPAGDGDRQAGRGYQTRANATVWASRLGIAVLLASVQESE